MQTNSEQETLKELLSILFICLESKRQGVALPQFNIPSSFTDQQAQCCVQEFLKKLDHAIKDRSYSIPLAPTHDFSDALKFFSKQPKKLAPLAIKYEKLDFDFSQHMLFEKLNLDPNNFDLDNTIETLQSYIDEKQESMQQLKEKIVEMLTPSYASSPDMLPFVIKQFIGITPIPTIEQVENAFLSNDLSMLVKIHPDVASEGVQKKIATFLISYEESAIDYIKANRALARANQAKINEQQHDCCAPLVSILNQSIYRTDGYPLLSPLDLAIFMQRSGIILKDDRFQRIRYMVSLYCFEITKRDPHRLPIILVNTALYPSFKDSFMKIHKYLFKQECFTFYFTPSDMKTLACLKQIDSDLQKGLDTNKVLIMPLEMICMLEIELQRLIKKGGDEEAIGVLNHIFGFFKEKAIAIWDEVDLLDYEMHKPHREQISLQEVKSIKDIITWFIEDERLNTLIDLKKERQGPISLEQWEQVVQIITEKCRTMVDLSIQKEFDLFMRQDLASVPENFKNYICTLMCSDSERERMLAERIIFIRYMIRERLLDWISQSPGLHFGRNIEGASQTGEVVPYIGEGWPSDMRFNCSYEAAVKHFMTAVRQKVILPQLQKLRDHIKMMADKEAAFSGCPIQNTYAYHHFEQLIGVDLLEAQEDRVLSNVLDRINQDLNKVLSIEAETILQYDPYYLSVHMIPTYFCVVKNIRGLWEEYHQVFPTLDVLSNNTEIFVLQAPSIEILLQESIRGEKKIPDVIIDMGAWFKRQDYLSIVQSYLRFAHEQCTQKKAIIFFHRMEGEMVNNRLAIGKYVNHEFVVVLLPDRGLLDLEKQEVSLEECVIFCDQLHTIIGMNFSLPIGVPVMITCDKTITSHALLQLLMLMQQSWERVTFAFLEEDKTYIFKKSIPSIEGMIEYLEGQGQVRTSYHSSLQQMKALCFERYKDERQHNPSPEEVQAIYDKLICLDSEDPYEQFFDNPTYCFPKEALKKYSQMCIDLFQCKEQKLGENDPFSNRITQILQQFGDRGNNCDLVCMKKKVAKRLQDEWTQPAELQQELERYLQRGCDDLPVNHYKWWETQDSLNYFIIMIRYRFFYHGSSLCSLSQLFLDVGYDEAREFDKMFNHNILITKMHRHSKTQLLPFVHKSQRLSEQVFVVQVDNKKVFVILSAAEAAFIMQTLVHEPRDGVWLLHASGRQMVRSVTPIDLCKDDVMSLVQINIFAGRATSIEDLPGGVTAFHSWLQEGGGSKKDRRDFVMLRSANRPSFDHLQRLTTKERMT